MDDKKTVETRIKTGNIADVNGEINIAAGNIYKGFTAEQVSLLIEQFTSTRQAKKFDGRPPYKGLESFDEDDFEVFFGREKLVHELINRVKKSKTIFITGPSGSGKSSVIRAGLIHALKHGAIKESHSERWLYEAIKPGRDPIEALALAFSRMKSPELANYFRQHFVQKNTLNECIESALSNHKDQHLILFIDQFEEVFTQTSEEKAEVFINVLTDAMSIENSRLLILFAMRSDFISNCANNPKLNAFLNHQFIQIGAMEPDELVSAIAQPALQVDLSIDTKLIVQIINDMKGEPGTLPLMQFALKDLFDAEQAKGGLLALTREAYLKRGGIHKSLERHADNAFSKLSESEKELARSIFSSLIEIGHGSQDTRRTALFHELVPTNTNSIDVQIVVQKLADARLITTDEQAGKYTITLAHEKLIDAWPWLNKLVNDNRELIALQNKILKDAQEWEEHNSDASYLYSGKRLATVREKIIEKSLSEKLQRFISASINAQGESLRKSEGLRAVFELTSTLTETLSYRQVLDTALDLGHKALNPEIDPNEPDTAEHEVSAILLFKGNELTVGSARRFTHVDMQIKLQGNDGILRKIIEEGEVALITNVVDDPELGHIFALQSCSSIYLLPIRNGFNVYGVILFAHTDSNFFTKERCELIDFLSRQVTIAVQNARLYQDLVEERERIVDIQEETRKKLARDLHDGPTQSVAAIAMRVNLARRMMKKDVTLAEDELQKIEELAYRTTKEVRHMLFTLRPLILESQGLAAALRAMAEKMRETFAQNLIISVNEEILGNMEMGKQGVIFYIIEEATNNARKYASAAHIWVRLRGIETGIALLEIEDDGLGFDIAAVNKSHDSYGGLVNLRERTVLVNGLLNVDSALGKGTRIQVYIPLTEEAANRLHNAKR